MSVGAIIGLLLSIGYGSEQIIDEALKLKLFDNLLSSFNFFRLREIIVKRGIVDPGQIQQILDQLVTDKYGYVPNLLQLYTLTGINFVTVALNLTKGIPVFFDWKTHPNIKCTYAAILSSNIPGFFQPVFYEGSRYVDGAFANPYPIDYFKDDLSIEILGIYIDLPELVQLDQHHSNSNNNNNNRTSSEAISTMDNPLVELYRSVNSSMFIMRKLLIKNNPQAKIHHLLLSGNQLDPPRRYGF